jgi:hypothetical protein
METELFERMEAWVVGDEEARLYAEYTDAMITHHHVRAAGPARLHRGVGGRLIDHLPHEHRRISYIEKTPLQVHTDRGVFSFKSTVDPQKSPGSTDGRGISTG